MTDMVLCALVEVTPLEGCTMLDPGETAGAAVRCYTLAESELDARARINSQLASDRFNLESCDWCVAVDSVEWDNPDSETGKALEEEARTTKGVVYDTFHAWGYD